MIRALRRHVEQGSVTLLYAAQNQDYNHAVALKTYLNGQPPGTKK